MRILVISSYLPYFPDSGSKIRTYNLVKYLAKKHRVYLLCFSESESELKHQEVFKDWGISAEGIPACKFTSMLSWFWHRLANLFSPIPWVIRLSSSPKMQQRVSQVLRANQFDVVLVEGLYMSQYARDIKDVATILDEHNVESIIHRRLLSSRSSILRPYYFSEWLKLQSYEKRACKKFSKVLAVSEQDKQVLKKWIPNLDVVVVPNGVDTEYFRPIATDSVKNSIVFTGIMNWRPNVDAVCWFTTEILPLIRKRIPDITFYIVGQKPAREVLKLPEQDPNVVVTRWVEDVRPFIAQAGAYVAPIRAGSGTRLKILEAMALERPVVSTSLGCEGLKVCPGEDVCIADEPEEFAQKVVGLLAGKRSNETVSKARQLVEETYDWKECLSKLDEVCK